MRLLGKLVKTLKLQVSPNIHEILEAIDKMDEEAIKLGELESAESH
jgi:hypothetical protein